MTSNLCSLYTSLSDNKITHINAGYRKFNLQLVKNLEEEGQKCWGKTDFDRCQIYLELEASHDIAVETLLHEIMHVVLHFVGFDTDEGESGITATNEELVSRITKGLMLINNLNRKLFKILLVQL